MEKKVKKARIPVLFEDKSDCCGCTACVAICSQKAIIMIEDEKGFEYPSIIYEKCIGCWLCINTCPIKNNTN